MKKKLLSIVVLVALLCTMFAGCSFEDLEKKIVKDDGVVDPATVLVADLLEKTVQTDSFVIEDTEYVLYDDATASVKKYNGTEKEIQIATSIDVDGKEFKIVGIENKAFYRNADIQKLVIPENVLVIGNFAFMSCKNLEEITIGKDVEYIGVSAFQADKAPQNNRQKRLDENEKEIVNHKGEPVFYDGVGNLKHIEWIGAPKVIAENAFYLNDKLDEIVLPVGVEEIGEWAFAKCSGVKRVILPDTLKSIGAYSFMKNVLTEEIRIPGSCKTISKSAFYRNSNATVIALGEGVEVLAQGAFEECESIEVMDLPQSVQSVDKYVFSTCSALKKVRISENATIHADAFRNHKDVTIEKF